jgi:hypothetical protein
MRSVNVVQSPRSMQFLVTVQCSQQQPSAAQLQGNDVFSTACHTTSGESEEHKNALGPLYGEAAAKIYARPFL